MRKMLVLAAFLATLAGGYYYLTREKIIDVFPIFQTPGPLSTPSSHTPLTINFKDRAYTVAYYPVRDTRNIELIPNFTEKSTAKELQQKHGCVVVINGGFYTPEGRPTGLFISQGKTTKQATSSTLLDGFIVEDGDKVYIGSVPQNDAYWALQTGPRIFINGEKRKLSLVRDEYARRMLALNTSRNELYLMAIYSKENAFDGPQLVDLPEVVELVGKELQIRITDAINLDGGSASAFISPDVSLAELSPIGSFFCVK